MATFIKKHLSIFAIFITTLTAHAMEITPKDNQRITGVLSFDPDANTSGYAGFLMKTNAGLKPSLEEHVHMMGHIINIKFTEEEQDSLYENFVKTSPQMIEFIKEQNLNPHTVFLEKLCQPSAIIKISIPVSTIINLQYGDIFYHNGIEFSFHDMPEKLKVMRKNGKHSPAIFTIFEKDKQDFIEQEIVTINPNTGFFEHGIRGAGPKQKSNQTHSDR